MKLLHCIHSADPRVGGTIEGVRQSARLLAQRGHQVEVATLDPPDSRWLPDFPCKIYGLGPHFTSYGFARGFEKWLVNKSSEMDVVIGNGLWQYNNFAMRRACLRTRTPYFVFPHGMLDPWFKRAFPLKHLRKWLYWPWGEYPVLRDARGVLFCCEEERRLARQSFWLYKANEIVAGQGTNLPDGDPVAQRAAFFARYPELSGKRILLFLSRIHPKKGCDLVIEAFACVAGRDASLQLVFAGPDQIDWKATLQERCAALGIADRVSWLGMIDVQLKWGAMRSAEVFVLPSHQENFGIAVVEALACGLPVLISNQVNIWREIEADKGGMIDSDDAAGTTRLLEKWLALSAPQRAEFARCAFKCFQTRFELGAVTDRFLAIMQSDAAKRL